jgi:8-oxo-dGTP pyrophosphatase MutT (NUDIX family)
MPSPRLTFCSVTVFLRHVDQFLFLQRPNNKKVDSGRVNGVGGKLENGENYLAAAVRETKEETGYQISAQDMRLAGIARIQGGYPEDWIVSFFTAQVKDKTPPIGWDTPHGQLFWTSSAEVLSQKYNLVDDIYIVLPIIEEAKNLFFLSTQMDQNEKVAEYTLSLTPVSSW